MLTEAHDWQDEWKERRRFHRVPTDCPAVLLSTALGRVNATVLDLSQSGCRIRLRAKCRRGDQFVLRIGSFGPRAVTIAWHDGNEVGMVFAELLAWTVVSAIAFAPSGGSADR